MALSQELETKRNGKKKTVVVVELSTAFMAGLVSALIANWLWDKLVLQKRAPSFPGLP